MDSPSEQGDIANSRVVRRGSVEAKTDQVLKGTVVHPTCEAKAQLLLRFV
jgi:hypothetical protein